MHVDTYNFFGSLFVMNIVKKGAISQINLGIYHLNQPMRTISGVIKRKTSLKSEYFRCLANPKLPIHSHGALLLVNRLRLKSRNLSFKVATVITNFRLDDESLTLRESQSLHNYQLITNN